MTPTTDTEMARIWEIGDPTERGDQVAQLMREHYEANKKVYRYREGCGDNLMIGLLDIALRYAQSEPRTTDTDGLVERQFERLKQVATALANGAYYADDDECHPLYPSCVAATQILRDRIQSDAKRIAELEAALAQREEQLRMISASWSKHNAEIAAKLDKLEAAFEATIGTKRPEGSGA